MEVDGILKQKNKKMYSSVGCVDEEAGRVPSVFFLHDVSLLGLNCNIVTWILCTLIFL